MVAFAAALQNAMLGDDRPILSQRLQVHDLADLFRVFGESYWGSGQQDGLYRPLILWLLGAQKLLFGASLAAVHAVSLLLHGACSVLVLRILTPLLGGCGAMAGALLFAVHPIHAEAVITAYGQADLWAALFALAAVERWLAWSADPASRRRQAVLALLYLASLLCKESGVLLPALLMLLRGLYREPSSGGWRRWLSGREAALWLVLFSYLGLRLAVLGLEAVPAGEASVAEDYPGWARVNLVVVTLGTYLRLLVLPAEQTIYYGHLRDSLFGLPLAELAWLIGVLGISGWLGRFLDYRIILFSLGWLALTLLPVANLLPIGIVVAERCLYLPSVAVAALAGALFERLYARVPAVAAAIGGLLLLAAMAASIGVSYRWRTPLHHWQATVEAHPRSPMAHAMVGLYLLEQMAGEVGHRLDDPRLERAERAIDAALALNRRSPEALQGKGLLALLRGDCRAALDYLGQARRLRPEDLQTERLIGYCR